MFGSAAIVIPGSVRSSIIRNEMPRCFGASGSVRTRVYIASEVSGCDQSFWPFTTNSSPSRTARHCSEARSEPLPGSE